MKMLRSAGKITLRILLALLSLAGLFILFLWVSFSWLNKTNGQLEIAGQERRYFLYVPESYDPSTPTPLVITIHGFAQWPAHQMQISGWNELADRHGFIVVYPSGTGFPLRWRTSGSPGSETDPLLEVEFISALIDALSLEYNLDPARIYANGLSNGGGMSVVLACRLSERIAAIGSVSGAYLFPWEDCNPARAVPAIVFHGTADPIVPYLGGPSERFDIPFPDISGWVAVLAGRNGCAVAPQELPTSGAVSGVQFTGCAGDVVFYTIAESGHSWPGGEPLPVWIAGETSMDIDATQTMWEFFQAHPLVAPGE